MKASKSVSPRSALVTRWLFGVIGAASFLWAAVVVDIVAHQMGMAWIQPPESVRLGLLLLGAALAYLSYSGQFLTGISAAGMQATLTDIVDDVVSDPDVPDDVKVRVSERALKWESDGIQDALLSRIATFRDSYGPETSALSMARIRDIIQDEGAAKRFLSYPRRLAISLGSLEYGPFIPSPDNGPWVTLGDNDPDYSVGWAARSQVNDGVLGLRSFGWQAVFNVTDQGTSRVVTVRVEGFSERRESKRLVERVFARL